MTAYLLEIRTGTICQRCAVPCTQVMACKHNTRMCGPCAFYEPCERCECERLEEWYADQYGDADCDLPVSPTPPRKRTVDVKDPRLT